MPWSDKQSPRNSALPRDWQRLRRHVLERDGFVCQECGRADADQVDHIVGIGEGGTHHPSNLRAVHRVCVASKNAAEAGRARARQQAQRWHPRERHPGELPP